MRHLLITVALLTAAPASAEVFEMQAPVREVTLYPQGASLIRIAKAELPVGSHEIVITGLPRDTSPDSLRIAAEGAVIGAVSLQTGRALPSSQPDPAAVQAAREEVQRLERVLRDRDAGIASIRAEVAASEDLVAFLRDLAGSEGAASGNVAELADTVGTRILAARRAGIDAETRALEAEQGREDDVRRLDNARAQLAALQQPSQRDEAALVIAVEGQGGAAEIRIRSNADAASWRPVYDLRLDQEAETLTLERELLVSQSTGEDWSDVSLTLSTARPSQRSVPSEVHSEIIRAIDPQQRRLRGQFAADAAMPMAESDVMLEAAPVVVEPMAKVDFMGATAVYRYGSPVDLRNGVDALRLSLDSRDLPVSAMVAEAVPLYDSTAYLVVESQNTLDEVILPGEAVLYADGAMIGQRQLDLTAAGDEMTLGFGAIDGIVLERRLPDRATGDRGLIRRSTELNETAILSAENLTGRDYTLRMIDRIPVSEQEDLRVDWTASVQPTETDPDGKRGVLVWEMPLAAGDRQEITLQTELNWPEDMELIR